MPTLGVRAADGLVFASCLALGCVETFDGNGALIEEPRAEQGFDSVSSRGVLDVAITPGPFSVLVRIDENLQRRVSTAVDDDTLVIEVDGGNLGERLPGPHVVISMPALRDAELNGSGSLTAEGFEDEEPVALELAGSGELSWSGEASALDAVLNGSGEMLLDGSADSLDLYLAGSGNLDARSLTARGADIELEGSGSISATVDGRVDASATVGSIELAGNVTEGTWVEADGGTVNGP